MKYKENGKVWQKHGSMHYSDLLNSLPPFLSSVFSLHSSSLLTSHFSYPSSLLTTSLLSSTSSYSISILHPFLSHLSPLLYSFKPPLSSLLSTYITLYLFPLPSPFSYLPSSSLPSSLSVLLSSLLLCSHSIFPPLSLICFLSLLLYHFFLLCSSCLLPLASSYH